ncbi:MAG: hypothetical protein KatS3mg031_2045 [Chitinophagales bacterium]|nr:MAG: hypothetical protein KatS3mg031_2045 [Chitinophagales bacterium]
MLKHYGEPPIFLLKENFYAGKHPCFYNPETFPWVKEVEQQWEVIREEIMEYLRAGKNIEGLSSYTPPDLSQPTAWKNLYFMNFLWIQYKNCRKFPKTWNILRKIPGVTFAAIGILEPHSRILPHYGDTNINLRCHMGIQIPANYPVCGIQVGSEARGWEEGKVLMFSDCHRHTTWNDSDERRIIVGFDVIKEGYETQRTWLCAQFLGAQTLRFIDSYIPFLEKTPLSVLKPLHKLFSALWFVYLPIQARVTNFLLA